jgi:putative kinase
MSRSDMTTHLPRQAGGLRTVLVNGLEIEVSPHDRLMDDVLVPELERLSDRSAGTHRTFVFLVAPPATGKSVLVTLLVERARHLDLDAVGIDGFHLPQANLERTFTDVEGRRTSLASIKGSPDTFDVEELERCLARSREHDIAWPVYDRTLHDVVPAARVVGSQLVVVEGNWLLLDDPRWRPLAAYSAFNIFIDAPPELLRRRLIDRKVRGGATEQEAEAFYERSDRLNVQRVLEQTDRTSVDLELRLRTDGSIQHVDTRRTLR